MARLKLTDLQRRILVELEEIGADEIAPLAATAEAQSPDEFWGAVDDLRDKDLVDFGIWFISHGKSIYAPIKQDFQRKLLRHDANDGKFRWEGRPDAHVIITEKGLKALGFGA